MEKPGQDNQISVQVAADCDDAEVDLSDLKETAEIVCRRFGLSSAAISIAIVDDDKFRKLNKQFHSSDNISDCLSFDLSDGFHGDSARTFELILNTQQAAREADLRGHSTNAELALYLVHGLLHNLGFDDLTESDAAKMHRMEDEILQELGYGCVYNAKAKAPTDDNRKTQK